jgi:acylpyruvate hydrolase
MRFFNFSSGSRTGVGLADASGPQHIAFCDEPNFPGFVEDLIAADDRRVFENAAAVLKSRSGLNGTDIRFLPPIRQPGKILCIGHNYADHRKETSQTEFAHPVVFLRLATGLVAHNEPMVRPKVSSAFDYEGELAVIIGKAGRNISQANAMGHVAGYSIFNDGSLRDYQTRTSQWTLGKNFDATAGFGPYFVSRDELPLEGRGVRVQTRLNGQTMQDGSTDDLIFTIPYLIEALSETMTLTPGDIIATGTPAGVGAARNPPVFMRPGDVCEVEVSGLGILLNPIVED